MHRKGDDFNLKCSFDFIRHLKRMRFQKNVKDHPVQESRVGRIFRQTDLNYSSWDAQKADKNKLL